MILSGWSLRGASQDLREPQGALQIPPLRYAPVGMTRGGRLLLERAATWMARVTNRYFAKTAGPSTSLRSGRDDNSVATGIEATKE